MSSFCRYLPVRGRSSADPEDVIIWLRTAGWFGTHVSRPAWYHGVARRIPAGRWQAGGDVSAGEWWLLFGVVASLLPAFLIVRTVLHVLNIPIGRNRSTNSRR